MLHTQEAAGRTLHRTPAAAFSTSRRAAGPLHKELGTVARAEHEFASARIALPEHDWRPLLRMHRRRGFELRRRDCAGGSTPNAFGGDVR